jgi:ankyrin repeat protein
MRLASAQFPDFTPPTPLFGAVLHNNTTEARRLLPKGADPNQGRMFGSPAPFQALVEIGADIQARDGSGSTALMWAAFNEVGDPTLVEEPLRLGADPNVKNQMGETALT